MEPRKFNLEERLVRFAVRITNLAEALPNTTGSKYLSSQLIRSGLSPALNYGEAMGAESSNDFIHKMKIALKELRETFISLKIIKEKEIHEMEHEVESCLQECNELIAIFVKSIKTAQSNRGIGK